MEAKPTCARQQKKVGEAEMCPAANNKLMNYGLHQNKRSLERRS